MRYAIIDNSTLTAVQRLLGQIKVVNRICLDGDIVALENLIQAILFYDNLFFIDDYKEGFKTSRKKFFHFIEPIETASFPYGEIIKASAQSVDDLILKVQAGVIDDNDYGKFLEKLRMHTTFTWDMSSSKYFLTMKMLTGIDNLDVNKYTTIRDMIFLEKISNSNSMVGERDNKFDLIGSDGSIIKDSIGEQIYAFSSSLNWLSLRTAFYTFVGLQYNADIILHPIRSSFQIVSAQRFGLPADKLKPILTRLNGEARSCISDIKSVTDPIVNEMNLPLFSAWIIQKCEDPLKIFEMAFSIRSREPFISARRLLNEIEDISLQTDNKNYIKECNKILKSIRDMADKMRQIYGVQTRGGISISPVIFIINQLGKLKGLPSMPNIPIKIPFSDGMLEIGLRSGFKGVYKIIIEDLTSVQQLGSIHEKLTSKVVYKREPEDFLAKQEDIRYFGKGSFWKKPM